MAESQGESRFIFPRWANYLLPLMVVTALGGATYVPFVVGLTGDPATKDVGYRPAQPIPYSHAVHVGQLGMDCRACHTTVETGAFAAIPSSQVCFSCHNNTEGEMGIRKSSDKLAPLYRSMATGEPIDWVKVHDLPDYVYFDHSAHVNKGVGCITCHGPVDRMGEEGVYQFAPMSMAWCLDCHRQPERYLRPIEEVTNMNWMPPDGDQIAEGLRLKAKYNIHDQAYMTSCSTCHR